MEQEIERKYFVCNEAKNLKKIFCFLDNCILLDPYEFFLLRTKYMSSAVKVLTNSPRISDITKTNLFQLYFLHNDEKI